MSDMELMLLVESRKKSGWLAAFLNLFIPGAGYMYCGRWIFGIIAFVFVWAMIIMSFGIAAFLLPPLLFIDGFLSAGRHNKKLIEAVIKDRAAVKDTANT